MRESFFRGTLGSSEEEELDVGEAVSLGGTQRVEVATMGKKNTLE